MVAALTPPVSVAIGSAISDPRAVTGAWEQSAGNRGAAGFDIEISTEISGAPKSLDGETQRVVHVWITPYVRHLDRSERLEWSSDYGDFSWVNNHLVLHQRLSPQIGKMDLDVTFDPKTEAWHGTMQNSLFSGKVDLRRPDESHVGFPIIGDWISGDSALGGFACHHISLGAGHALVIWSDIIGLPGLLNYANGVSPPASTREWYGDFDMDAEMKDTGRNMLFFTGSAWSGDLLLGHVDTNDTFTGSFAHFGNGLSTGDFAPLRWRRGSQSDCPA